MSLYTVTTGNTVLAADINQIINTLQRPSGSTETGAYYIDSWANASGDEAGNWVGSVSRGAVPVSVTIDTSITAAVSCNAPSTNLVNANGFHVFTTSTGAAIKFYVGGLYTLQY